VQTIDVLVVVWIAITAMVGLRRGFTGQVVALIGFAIGAVIGSRLAPALLSGGDRSPWKPIAALVGAIVCGLLLQAAATPLANRARAIVHHSPFAPFDRAGGLITGSLLGLLAVWMLAVAALHQPALGMRSIVQRSALLPPLVHRLPASVLMDALQRFDRLPVIAAALGDTLPPPDPQLPHNATIANAAVSVVRIDGDACSLELRGSGWVIRPQLVVTNAHVIAGEDHTQVQLPDGSWSAYPVYVNPALDVAILRVPGLQVPPLVTHGLDSDTAPVALIGYPGGGGLKVAAGTAGRSVTVLAADAYGHGLAPRTVVPIRGPLRHGDSGGPVLDRQGRVLAMMFAANQSGSGGFGIPVEDIVAALPKMAAHADSGPCIG
jgi:S1-C subfamily serine protease